MVVDSLIVTPSDLTTESTVPQRAFVLGLDGVPWEQLRKWARAGSLPTFARLFEEGATGPLDSTRPASTALAWPSITTGLYPDRHGVYGWQRLTEKYTHRMNTSEDIDGLHLWKKLTPAVVGNVPMTYPADTIDGEMVTGLLTPSLDHSFTHPPDIAEEIREQIHEYTIGLDWAEYGPDERVQFIDDLEELVQARRELLLMLMERDDWRLFFFVFTAPDRLQHIIWDEDILLDHYKVLDDILKDVVEYVGGRDATLYIVSDHGFGTVNKYINLNVALQQAGLLTEKSDSGTRSLLGRLGITRDRLRATMDSLGIDEKALVRTLPESLVETVATGVPGNHSLFDVDYTETKAFVHEAGKVYVNDTDRFINGTIPPDEVDDVVADVIDLFESICDPETGEKALEVYDGRDLYPNDNWAPDVVIESDDHVPQDSLGEQLFEPASDMAADHDPEGIFLAWGPDIKRGATVKDASVVDIAPTVLHSTGVAIPDTVDGRVLESIFEPESPTANRTIRTTQGHTEDSTVDRTSDSQDKGFENVEDRLRGLGYME